MENPVPATIVVKESKYGKGVFTTIPLKKDTALFKITGSHINFSETLNMGNDQCYCLQVGLEDYIIPDFPFLFSNHSCNPNCGINENLELTALKNIEEGAELVWDYSTSMLERSWTMECKCGAANCREVIRDFDLLPETIMSKYLNKKIVLPYITNYLIREKSLAPVISMLPSALIGAGVR